MPSPPISWPTAPARTPKKPPSKAWSKNSRLSGRPSLSEQRRAHNFGMMLVLHQPFRNARAKFHEIEDAGEHLSVLRHRTDLDRDDNLAELLLTIPRAKDRLHESDSVMKTPRTSPLFQMLLLLAASSLRAADNSTAPS